MHHFLLPFLLSPQMCLDLSRIKVFVHLPYPISDWVAIDANETFAWVRISLTSQDLFHSQQSTPRALQASSSATAKPGLLAQTPLSQGKELFPGCKSFGEISAFSGPFLDFAIAKVRNAPLMIVERSSSRTMCIWGSHGSKPAQVCQYSNPFPVACHRWWTIPGAMENGPCQQSELHGACFRGILLLPSCFSFSCPVFTCKPMGREGRRKFPCCHMDDLWLFHLKTYTWPLKQR